MTSIRTLVLTDVVDNTKLSEALGDAAMAQVWAAHDRVARDLLPVPGRQPSYGELTLDADPCGAPQSGTTS